MSVTTVLTRGPVKNKDVVIIKSKSINDVRDKWIGNYSYGLEKRNMEYIKKELKL